MHKLLDPTLDIVFKLLFTRDADSDEALRGLLAAVLAPPKPIAVVRVINAAVAGIDVDDKSVALDLSLELVDGTKLDLEMQVRKEDNFRNRALLYWAKLFGGQLERGGSYAKLRPAISILFLGYSELPGDRLHSVFHILEAHDHQRLTDAFEMHIIELPKLQGPTGGVDPYRGGDADAALLRWSRFFAAETDEALKDAAMSDPAIQKAHAVLKKLSADPDVRLLVQRRELSQQAYRLEMSAALDRGRHEGLDEGRKSGLRTAILDACALLDITPTAEQLRELEDLDINGLDALRARLKQDRRWALDRLLVAECSNTTRDSAPADPAIQKAQSTLDPRDAVDERLSADPDVRLLVQRRELSQQAYRLELETVRHKALGHARAPILDICEVLGVTPTDEQRAELERLDGPGLDALRARLMKDRSWALGGSSWTIATGPEITALTTTPIWTSSTYPVSPRPASPPPPPPAAKAAPPGASARAPR